jgi:glucose-6-phosphate isomerase
MSSLTLDYTNCLASSIGATHGLTDAAIDTLVAKFPKHHENIEELRATGESAFFELPYQDLTQFKELLKTHKGKWENLVVLGTAGATIGARALMAGLVSEHWNLLPAKNRKNGPRLFFVDNADPKDIQDLTEVIDPKKTLFLFNSRSGNTAETNALFLWLLNFLKKKASKTAPAKQIVIATDPERSPLMEIATAEKIEVIPIPTNLSGRFGILHVSSLLPAALIGIDAEAVLAGAAAMDERCRHDRAMENPAYMHSLIHYLLTRKRRKTIHAMMGFSSRIMGTVDWYNHLLAVSLGKMLNKKGKAVHVGPSPAQCAGPIGCYGQMQLYQEGPFDKVLTFITVKDHGASLEVPDSHPKLEGLAYLGGAKVEQIMDQAYYGAAHVITSAGRPNMTVIMDDVSERSIGGLAYMLMLSTSMSAELYGIDAFDQPGVDANKQAVFAQLGRAGFEDKAMALEQFRAAPSKTC